jgi:lipopolysaccharide biosynthesis protein
VKKIFSTEIAVIGLNKGRDMVPDFVKTREHTHSSSFVNA